MGTITIRGIDDEIAILDHLAGTWDEKDYKEFQNRVADFEVIDENLWK